MQKRYRLRNRASFTYIYNKGARCSNNLFTLFSLHSKYGIKAGFAVGKKVGGAVQRNLVKRRLKEIFRSLIPSLKDNTNYIILARPETAEKTFDELKKSLTSLLKKANMFHVKHHVDNNKE
jgi:ribonuclease P protein component